jgi:hypothetical protein
MWSGLGTEEDLRFSCSGGGAADSDFLKPRRSAGLDSFCTRRGDAASVFCGAGSADALGSPRSAVATVDGLVAGLPGGVEEGFAAVQATDPSSSSPAVAQPVTRGEHLEPLLDPSTRRVPSKPAKRDQATLRHLESSDPPVLALKGDVNGTPFVAGGAVA